MRAGTVPVTEDMSSSNFGELATPPSTTGSYSVSPASSVVFENAPSKLASLTRHFTSPTFSRRAKSSASLDDTSPTFATNNGGKGPYGLTTLSRPNDADEAIAHIVFVHGLGGGSEHTWTKDDIFWPRDLLPAQEPFQDAGIHSFGYDSDFKKSSTLNINDFSKSLLNSLLNSPITGHSKAPVIIVCHSMGGLVAKRAVILSKALSIYEEIATRIKAIVFVATPQSGSNLAGTLSKLFSLHSGLKPYLEDLGKNSDTVQSINADFPSHSLDLLLYSFYETKPLRVGIRDVMIVPKSDAILNYHNEQSALLYGDHRSICKISSASDSNFIAIWQSLATCIRKLQVPTAQRPRAPSLISQFNEQLSQYLNVWEPPVDDLYRLKSDRVPGSCQWLTDNKEYQRWLSGSAPGIYWLRGPPGCGKSYTSGYALEGLELKHKQSCYFFFVHGDRTRSSMGAFLLSMTWQMATLYPAMQDKLLRICSRDAGIAKSSDYRTLVRKFWEQGILLSDLGQETYWVVDAIDECRHSKDLVKFLLRVEQKFGGKLKIFITTRTAYTDHAVPAGRLVAHDVNIDDVQVDIARYLDMRTLEAPGASQSELAGLKDLLLKKANGCFLWVILVLENISKVVGTQARLKALEEFPPGMDQLYSRLAQSMSDGEQRLTKEILTWATLAVRPLTTSELRHVIEGIAKDEVDDIETIVSRYCNDMLYVDKNKRVRMRHASARDFLLRHDINSDVHDTLTISKSDGHETLALACLDYLNGPEMKMKPKRRMVAVAQQRSAFAAYACENVNEHVNRCSALSTKVLASLATFLKTNVLVWIEELAKAGKLESVLQFAQVLRVFLRRKSRTNLLLGEEVVVIEDWSIDLVKIVSKFGQQLLLCPEAILHLLPPFCPRETAAYSQFARGIGTTLTVAGLATRTWDDCLCTVTISEPHSMASGVIRRERLLSMASSPENLCIGTSLGRIAVFNTRTILEENLLEHDQPVLFMRFATSKPLLVSASRRLIRLWNTETWEEEWKVPSRQVILDMAFVDEDQLLLVALKDNTLLALNLIDRTTSSTSWMDILQEPDCSWYSELSPEHVAFNTDLGVLALGYRHRNLLIYNYDQETYQIYDEHHGLSADADQHVALTVYAMAFSNLPDSPLLAVSFSCADLVLYDVDQGTVQARVSPAWFSHLVSSPDGRTLAAARTDGTIELYDFETLQRLYRIRSDDGTVAMLDYSAENTRLFAIRAGGRHCRIWDPPALFRRDVGHDSVRTPSLGSGSQDGVYEEIDEPTNFITAIACDPDGQSFYVGKGDNSVAVYDARTGDFATQLFDHVASIKQLFCGIQGPAKLLLSVDTAGFLTLHKLVKNAATKTWSAEMLFTHRASTRGIQQFLCSKDMRQFLIVSNDQASLHKMESGEQIGLPVSCKPEDHQDGGECVWTHHPLDPSLLLCVTTRTVFTYEWATLTLASTTAEGSSLKLDLGQTSETDTALELSVHSATTLFVGPQALLAVSYSHPESYGTNRRGKGSKTFCFPASAFSQRDKARVAALSDGHAVFDMVDTFIGMYRERFVFLHVDGWVCSVKAGAFGQNTGAPGAQSEGVAHHFPPPLEWLRTNRNLLIEVTRLGDVLFVVKGEVAVVKRGLDRVAEIRGDH